jgi:hypothetical protein
MADAQALWQAAEAIHALTYFDRTVRRAIRAAGAPSFWAGYFGTRLAPLHTDDPWLAGSVLYVFARPMIEQHLPSPDDGAAWDAARRVTLRSVLRGLGGAAAPPPQVWAEAAEALRHVVEAGDTGARPLFAAHAGVPWPDDPWLATWWATTLLREYRGDGHLHVLAGEGLGGCEAFVLALRWRHQGDAADDSAAADRGWSDHAIAAAYARLRERGWVDEHRRLTAAGRAGRADVERATDARGVPSVVTAEQLDAAVAALAPLADLAIPHIPARNPIGVTGGEAA